MATKKSEQTQSSSNARPKKTCPITRDQFRKSAKPLSLQVNGIPMAASVKEFSTGSFGWYHTGKTTVEIDGVPTDVQLGLNLTIIGSKEAK